MGSCPTSRPELDASARPGSAKGAPPELRAAVLGGLREHESPPVLLLTAPGEEEAARQVLTLAGEGHNGRPGLPPVRRPWSTSASLLSEKLELYFLTADIGEKHDLASRNPRLVKELHARLVDWREETGARMSTANPKYDPEKKERR